MLAVMLTGELEVGLTVVPGVRLHPPPGIFTLHEIVTGWLNDPAAVTWKFTGEVVVPGAAVTAAGEGVVRPKSITCRARPTW
jgi:hypothetical protein